MSFLVVQALSGLAQASALFLVAAGLSIIFGVTRVVNFAHGALYMLGAYIGYSATAAFGFWPGVIAAALAVGLIAAVMEIALLKRIYQAPELFQLLATFGVTLMVQDLVVAVWGPRDLLGPRAPGLTESVSILGQSVPSYDLFLIAVGPAVLLGLRWLFKRTRFGVLARAATADREMVAALGVNQAVLFTAVFALGGALAGLGGALALPRITVTHTLDIQVVVEAFVVVVVGGMGSVAGAFLASVLFGLLNAFGIVLFPQATLVLMFLAMAVVLTLRPQGLLGKPELTAPRPPEPEPPLRPFGAGTRRAVAVLMAALVALPFLVGTYGASVASEVLIFALFAASLQFVTGLGGMISFGHAAYFAMGAYAAALLSTQADAPMLTALAGATLAGLVAALVFGRFVVRLSGVYLAMLTLAFAQLIHAVSVQWLSVTGGDNGILGVWPDPWAASAAGFFWLTLALAGGGLLLIRVIAFAPLGFSIRAVRDSEKRADAIGLDPTHARWAGFALGGVFAGLAGGLYAFLKGSVFPDVAAIPTSVDALVMMLLGGVQSLTGPIVGAAVFKLLQITLQAETVLWKSLVGGAIVAMVLLFPGGIVGMLRERFRWS